MSFGFALLRRKWRLISGVAIVLTVIAGMVCSIVHKLKDRERDQHVNRGQYHFNRQEHDAAIREFTEAIRLDPRCALAYANRASSYFNRGELERAIADCNHALQINSRLVLAYANRAGAFLTQGDNERAIADCQQ